MSGATGRLLAFRVAIPIAALAVATASLTMGAPRAFGALWPAVELATLVAAVFVSVHHADVIAHRTGEPFGTLVLTVAVTVIEVALILSIMLAGDGGETLARDTVFAVVMIVCNGLVGLCLVVGGFRYGEQGFRLPGASAYLVVLMPLATFTLIMPSHTTSEPGPYYSQPQLVFAGLSTLVLYGVFLYVQTVRHRDYFLSGQGDAPAEGAPTGRAVASSALLLFLSLTSIVLLAKSFADSLKVAVLSIGAPLGFIGLLVALLVLLPESLAALKSARRDELLAMAGTLARSDEWRE
jgi:Ca2+:H+ antiporter